MHCLHDYAAGMNLRELNVNQLVALDALLETRSVRRAAEAMGLTQPAMSHTLRHLRDRFDDPLLVRVGNRMAPTPFAEAMAPRLRTALRALEDTINQPPGFDPARTERRFVIGASDAFAQVVLPGLLAALRVESPGLCLWVGPVPDDAVAALSAGRVDVCMLPPHLVDPVLLSAPLLAPGWAVLARRRHPGLKKGLTPRVFSQLGHIVVRSEEPVSQLAKEALAAFPPLQVVVQVAYFSAVPALVAATDLLALVPDLLARRLAGTYGLEVYPSPVALPDVPLMAAWHPRFDNDPAHRWFRQRLMDAYVDEGRVRPRRGRR